jgi:hypothetical protein
VGESNAKRHWRDKAQRLAAENEQLRRQVDRLERENVQLRRAIPSPQRSTP